MELNVDKPESVFGSSNDGNNFSNFQKETLILR